MLDESTGHQPDPDGSRTCPDCGWHGPETAMQAAGGEATRFGVTCPRCGAPTASDMPSVAEIIAARRTPFGED